MTKDDFSDLNRIRLILLISKIKNSLLNFEADERREWAALNLEKELLEFLLKLVKKELNNNN